MGTSVVEKLVEIEKKKGFPLVAKSALEDDGSLIVFFASETKGTVLSEGIIGDAKLGEYSENWLSCFNMHVWQILDSVTITFKS